jgi:hypothetical protein
MLLPFKPEYVRAVLDGTKTTTWRWGWERWLNWARKARHSHLASEREGINSRGKLASRRAYEISSEDRLLQIYCRSPRNGGARLGKRLLTNIEIMPAWLLTLEDAETDGFESVGELHAAIAGTGPKGTTVNHRGALLTMGVWTVGPIDGRTLPEVL